MNKQKIVHQGLASYFVVRSSIFEVQRCLKMKMTFKVGLQVTSFVGQIKTNHFLLHFLNILKNIYIDVSYIGQCSKYIHQYILIQYTIRTEFQNVLKLTFFLCVFFCVTHDPFCLHSISSKTFIFRFSSHQVKNKLKNAAIKTNLSLDVCILKIVLQNYQYTD